MKNIFAIFGNHEAKKTQSLDNIRMEIKHGFENDIRECPASFLSTIIQTQNYQYMESYFALHIETSTFCTNKDCLYQVRSHHQSTPFIRVQITDECKTVQNLVNVTLQDKIIDGLCKQCGSPYGTSSYITFNDMCNYPTISKHHRRVL